MNRLLTPRTWLLGIPVWGAGTGLHPNLQGELCMRNEGALEGTREVRDSQEGFPEAADCSNLGKM